MSQRTSCDIYFDDNPSRVYYGGQLLSGRVVLKLYKEKTVRGIYVKIVGQAYCEWTTGSKSSKRTHIGNEYYLNEKTFFFGGDNGEVVVQPGEYNYTFSCRLPAQLPTSVEGRTGHIRYSVVVNLDRPLWPDQEFEVSFTVVKELNLNDSNALRYPVSKEERKTFFICCLLFCCETDPLFIKARMPVGGYTPGQTIILKLEINNKSDQPFYPFRVQFVKHIQYYTYANSSRTTSDTEELTETSCGGCSQGESKSYTLYITVPPVPPTDAETSNIVKVSYLLRITASADSCRKNPKLDLPVVIGTYPILLSNVMGQNTVTQQPVTLAPYPTDNLSSLSIPLVDPSDAPPYSIGPSNVSPFPTAPSYSSATDAYGIDPPTFEEAISGQSIDVNGKVLKPDATGKVFKPSYPVFRRTPSYSPDTNN